MSKGKQKLIQANIKKNTDLENTKQKNLLNTLSFSVDFLVLLLFQ